MNKYVESQITPYGELAVHKIKNASYHISLNHTPLTNNSHIDTEKNIHLTMLQYPWAERILLIGGTNKAVEEILRYPDVGSVYWGNVTPDIFSLPQDLFPTEVSDPQRLRMIKSSDARDFMHKFNVSDFFDVVIIDIPEPLNIFFNRYYSLEFFKNLSDVSVPHSILNLQIQAGENKLSKNEKNLSAVIFNTLKKNFPNTMQMKMKRTVVLSSPERGFTTSPLPLIEYLNSIDGVPETITPAFLHYTFAASEKILRQIENAPPSKLNSDLNPISLKYSLNEILYSLGIWHDFILKSVNNIKSFVIYVFFILPAIAGIFVFKKKSPEVKTAISFSIICAIWTIFLLTAATILHASSGKLYSGVSYLAFAGLGGVFICLKLLYSDKKYISYSFISKYCVLASLFFLLATSLLEFYLYPSIIIIALTVFTGSFILTGATAAAAANVFNKKPLLLYATASSAAALALSVLLLPAINLTEIFLLNVIFIISLIFLLNT
ncbi:MAG: hypothetical protein ACQESB_00090 [Elusimicrobiota bacterium]